MLVCEVVIGLNAGKYHGSKFSRVVDTTFHLIIKNILVVIISQ
jgi:hypothetical protein